MLIFEQNIHRSTLYYLGKFFSKIKLFKILLRDIFTSYMKTDFFISPFFSDYIEHSYGTKFETDMGMTRIS